MIKEEIHKIGGRSYRLESGAKGSTYYKLVDNDVVVIINGQPIIDRDMLSVEGKPVNLHDPRGRFVTPLGEIEVDLQPEKYSSRRRVIRGWWGEERTIIILKGEALRSHSRQAIRKQSPASKGIREIPLAQSGSQDLGKDPITGEFKRLTVTF